VNVLVVVAHPCRDSYTQACAAAAIAGLTAARHDVDVIDLYEQGFRPAMSREERISYDTDDPIRDPMIADHAARLKRATAVVFVYPTWWSGLPAILKGWLERVMVPGVGFTFDERTGKVKPGLGQIRRIVGISSYGSPRWYVTLVNDNGRRIITRALRMSCGIRARPKWFGLYAIDTADDEARRRHLTRIESSMAAL
jgi:putative NADPH-quinone reductase